MQDTSSTPTDLFNDLRSVLTGTFVRHGYSSKIVINNGSDPISQPPSGVSKLLIEVSFGSEIPLEVMMMDEVLATPISEFLKMRCFSSRNASILRTVFLYGTNLYGSDGKRKPVLVVGDLVDYTEGLVRKWRGVGKIGLSLIKSALDSIGLRLGMEPHIRGPKEAETKDNLLAKS